MMAKTTLDISLVLLQSLLTKMKSLHSLWPVIVGMKS